MNRKMISMISLDGYNLDKMDEIEQTLIDAFISQDEIDDADEFVQKNAPAEYIQYLKDYQKVKERANVKHFFTPLGKEFFPCTVSSFLHRTVR